MDVEVNTENGSPSTAAAPRDGAPARRCMPDYPRCRLMAWNPRGIHLGGWGIGPWAVVAVGAWTALAWGLGALLGIPRPGPRAAALLTAGGVGLLALGLPAYLVVLGYFLAHRRGGRLVQTGPYALVRHPLYTIGIFLLATGVACLLQSWALLSIPLASWAATRYLVRLEERQLFLRFGEEYHRYWLRTGAILPRLLRRSGTGRAGRQVAGPEP